MNQEIPMNQENVNCRQSNEEVAHGRHCRNVLKVRVRTVFLVATVVVMLASQGTSLQLSTQPESGSVRVRRSGRPYTRIPEPGSTREFRDCGGNLTAFSQPTMLYSPGYPTAYDSDRLCRWVINAVQGSVTLRFLDLHLEESLHCGFDSIGVVPGPGQGSAVKLCGVMTNHTIATKSSTVTVVFSSDDSHEAEGFSLEFYAEIDATGLPEECGDRLVGENGTGIVTSPRYPLQYPHNSSCWTVINVDPGRVIVIRFKDLALEADESCTFDYVEIFDGPSEGCTVTSGFENGTVASPRYPDNYPAAADCLIDLKAPREAKVALQFVDFSVELDNQCIYDFVEIRDMQQDGWRSIGRFCGEHGQIAELVSSENRMRLKFHSDNYTEARGFVAKFHVVFPQDRPQADAGSTTVSRKLVPALKLMQEIPGGLVIAQDGEALLNCIPKAPGSDVTWFKDGMMLNASQPLPELFLAPPNTLWIRRMHSNLTGSYTCRVVTKYLEAESTSVVVMEGTNESDDCSIQFQRSPEDQEHREGETMVMHCAAQVSLRPASDVKIAWLRNGQPFPTSHRSQDLGNGLAYVSDATVEDTAVYTCVATDRQNECSVRRSALYRVLPWISVDER